MLVLTRASGEVIRISDDIVIKVARVRSSNAITVGIDAPSDVAVRRSELPRHVNAIDPSVSCESSEPNGPMGSDDP